EIALDLLKSDHPRAAALFATDDTTLWRTLAALPLRFMSGVVCRVGLQPSEIGSFLDLLHRTQPRDSLWQAGVGDGRIRVVASHQSEDNGSEQPSAEFIER